MFIGGFESCEAFSLILVLLVFTGYTWGPDSPQLQILARPSILLYYSSSRCPREQPSRYVRASPPCCLFSLFNELLWGKATAASYAKPPQRQEDLKDKRREDDIKFIDFSLLMLVLTECFKVATVELACSSRGQKFLSHELHWGLRLPSLSPPLVATGSRIYILPWHHTLTSLIDLIKRRRWYMAHFIVSSGSLANSATAFSVTEGIFLVNELFQIFH